MYQFGFFPLTFTAYGKGLVNIQERVAFYINGQFSFHNKLRSSCNLAKHFGVWKQIRFWKVYILRKINVSCFYCLWFRNSTPQFGSLTETLLNQVLLTLSPASPPPYCSWDGLENWRQEMKTTGWDQKWKQQLNEKTNSNSNSISNKRYKTKKAFTWKVKQYWSVLCSIMRVSYSCPSQVTWEGIK